MKDNYLSGSELEGWVKGFAKHVGILSKQSYSLKTVVGLLHQELPTRFRNTRDTLYRDYPYGNEWIDSILLAKQEPSISAKQKQDFALYLLDKTLLTDVIIELQDSQSNQKRVVIDVTGNSSKEQLKFARIQGRPEPADRPQENRNANIGKVRKQLGFDQHLILTLSQDAQLLPNYDKLLSELQAFANTPSRTGVLNLQNVPEQERFLNQTIPESSKQTWARYNQQLNIKDPAQRLSAIATQTFQDGLEREIAIKVLLEDPFFLAMRTPAKAQELASQAINRIWSEQGPTQPAPHLEEKPRPEDWLKYASAIGRGSAIQAKIQEELTAYQRGQPLSTRGKIALGKDFAAFTKELNSIRIWYRVAKQLSAPSTFLQTIEDVEKAYQQGQPLSDATKATMRRDINQLAYNKLSTGLSQKDPQAFLVRLAANAAKTGMRPAQIKEILSLSPVMKEIQQQQGEKATSDRITKIIAEGLHLKNREQPRQRSFQQRSQQIDRGPSLGM
jgi:hypothetical protein